MNKDIIKKYLDIVKSEDKKKHRIIKHILSDLSCIYFIAVMLRQALYRLQLLKVNKLPCVVISVGNITAGGTGKTPAVIMLAAMLKESGKRVAILTRGYGRKGGVSGDAVVSDDRGIILDWKESGDEPYQMAKELAGVPVIISRKRSDGGRLAVEKYKTQVIIMDDGFQHRNLERDLDIVLIDGLSPFGNRKLLPAGLLREPLSGLKRADMFFISRADQSAPEKKKEIYEEIKKVSGEKPVIECIHKPYCLVNIFDGRKESADFIKGREVSIFSGIGNSKAFELSVASLGAKIKRTFVFPDHHIYSREEIKEITNSGEAVVTTEKDGVRLEKTACKNVWALKVKMIIIAGAEELKKKLEKYI